MINRRALLVCFFYDAKGLGQKKQKLIILMGAYANNPNTLSRQRALCAEMDDYRLRTPSVTAQSVSPETVHR